MAADLWDRETKRITIPCGDSATLNFHVSGGATQDGDCVVFRVKNLSTGAWAITKYTTFTSGTASIRLASADTRELSPSARYGWTIGIVTGASEDSNGYPVADDDNDNVLTAYKEFKDFVILGNGILGMAR